MKKIKKLIICCLCLLVVVGCSCSMQKSPKDEVKAFLKSYNDKDESVLTELDTKVTTLTYTDDQKGVYKKALERQYEDLKFEIIDEIINGDTATVTAKITVYDLYKAQKNADEYLTLHKDEFSDNDVVNSSKFLDYKLDKMAKTDETVDYTLSFFLNKVDGGWQLTTLDNNSLEKIHGIYNYD